MTAQSTIPDRYFDCFQTSMSVQEELITVHRDVLILLVPTPVPATVDSHWELMDDHAQLTLFLHSVVGG